MPNDSMQRGSIDQESEMLPQDPPPWFVRSMAWLLISMFARALLAAIAGEAAGDRDVSVRSRAPPRAPIRFNRRAWLWSARSASRKAKR